MYNPRPRIEKTSVFLKQYFNDGMVCYVAMALFYKGDFISYIYFANQIQC